MGSKNNILDEQFDSGTPVPTNKFVLDRNDFSSDTKKTTIQRWWFFITTQIGLKISQQLIR